MNSFYIQNSRWLTAIGTLSFASAFGQTFFISLFAGEIRDEFHISHSMWGGIYAIGTLSSAILMFRFGGLVDRYNVKTLSTILLISLSAFCFMMMNVSTIWFLPIIIFGLRFCGQGFLSRRGGIRCGLQIGP